ncbi:MAG: hypothetical protein WD771_12185 [Gemmatimonadaceae bacterium]
MPSSPSDRPAASGRSSWRALLLWGGFVVVLLGGVALAARHGATAPTLLETVVR